MAKDSDGILSEFEEFLNAKREREAADSADDEEVEIWNEKGQGARIRRSAAKPFLQSLGIDLDPEPVKSDDTDDKSDGKPKPKGRTSTSAPATGSAVRKYFTKPAGK